MPRPLSAQLPYVQLIDIKRWADRGLIEAISPNLAALGAEAAIMQVILDHILAVDRIFQHHLTGRPHTYAAARSATLPDFAALAAGLKETGDWYAAHVRTLSPEDFETPVDFVFTSGKPARMRRSEILLHICQHGAYHRGNAGALLQLKGLTPGPDSVTDHLEATA